MLLVQTLNTILGLTVRTVPSPAASAAVSDMGSLAEFTVPWCRWTGPKTQISRRQDIVFISWGLWAFIRSRSIQVRDSGALALRAPSDPFDGGPVADPACQVREL